MGGRADGRVTTVGERALMRRIVDAFRRGDSEGKPLYLQARLSFAKTDAAAVHAASDQRRSPMIASAVLAELRRRDGDPGGSAAEGARLG